MVGKVLLSSNIMTRTKKTTNVRQRTAVQAYRQALRDIPAQEGAPWDGGGKETPWPDLPAGLKT